MHGLNPDVGVVEDVPQIDEIDERLHGIALQRGNPDDVIHAAGHKAIKIPHNHNPQRALRQLLSAQVDPLVLCNDLPHPLARQAEAVADLLQGKLLLLAQLVHFFRPLNAVL
jgi:hypothetical protein